MAFRHLSAFTIDYFSEEAFFISLIILYFTDRTAFTTSCTKKRDIWSKPASLLAVEQTPYQLSSASYQCSPSRHLPCFSKLIFITWFNLIKLNYHISIFKNMGVVPTKPFPFMTLHLEPSLLIVF